MSTATESNTATEEAQQTCAEPRTFCWNELLTSDSEAAEKFYTGVFGWKTEAFPGEMPYKFFSTEDRQVGGLMVGPCEGMSPRWLSYVVVEDVDASAKKASQLGAKILLEPRDIPTVGRIAVFEDPQGATLGLFQPAAM